MKYSIIIPHKNSSKLLERLIKSIPNNNDIQIIVIDDNSKDEEKVILKKINANYNNLELYNNEGIGAGAARNTGLKYAKGKWVLFADADDFFTKAILDILLKYYDYNDTDIIYFRINSCYSDSLKPAYRDEHINNLFIRFSKRKDENFLRCCYLTPWGKIFNRNFINSHKFKFEEIVAGNDMMFSVKTGVKANKIIIDETIIYTVTVSSGSLTTTLSKEKFKSRFDATIRVNNFLKENHLSKYQISVLYFIAKSRQFGYNFLFYIIKECIRNKSNLFIGMKKLLYIKKVLQDRENSSYIKRE